MVHVPGKQVVEDAVPVETLRVTSTPSLTLELTRNPHILQRVLSTASGCW